MGRDDQRQAVKNIPLEQLKPFKNHPFQVRDDEEFRRLVESIEIHGVIHPAVARQIGEECYELISGHRRKAACEVLGYSKMPALVRSMKDDEAVVNMIPCTERAAKLAKRLTRGRIKKCAALITIFAV